MSSAVESVHHRFSNTHALQNLTRIFTKRRKWIIGSIVICELLAVILTLIMKPTYGSTAMIELNKNSSGSLDLGLGDDALAQQLTSGGEGLQTDLQTETSILEGDSLALAVIQRLGLASQPPFAAQGSDLRQLRPEQGLPLEEAPKTRTRLLKIFKSHLKVQPIHGTRLIQVTYESHDAMQAAQIANELI
jgi:succinoglycan biosynthesis transport protein ExoP